MEPRTMQYQFKKILKETEMSNTNFHILRHTFSTNCIEDGMDVKSLSEMLGHSDVQITLNRYVHPSMVNWYCIVLGSIGLSPPNTYFLSLRN